MEFSEPTASSSHACGCRSARRLKSVPRFSRRLCRTTLQPFGDRFNVVRSDLQTDSVEAPMVSLKEWLGNNPAITVLGVAATVASATSGLTTYLVERVNKAERIEL